MVTSQLGTSSSQLGNIVLGFGVTTDAKIGIADNTLTLSQLLELGYEVSREAFTNFSPTHSVSFNRVSGISASNTLSFGQSVSVVKLNLASNTLTYSQSATCLLVRAARNVLDIDHFVTLEGTYSKTVGNYFQYFQTLGLIKRLNISVGNSLVLTQVALAPSVKSGSNTLTLAQSVAYTNSKRTTNALSLSHALSVQIIRDIRISQSLGVTHTILKTSTKSYSVHSYFGPGHSIRQWKQFDISVDHSLNLTQEQVRERFDRDISSVLTLSQAVSKTKVIFPTANNSLSLTAAMLTSNVLSRSVSNTLSFLNNHTQYVPIGGLGDVIVPNTIVTNIRTRTIHGKRIFPYCVLNVPERAITLPAPEFGDSEALAGLFTIRRSMVGGTFTYVHRVPTSKLHYDFVFGQRKARELEDYLLNYNSRVHTWTNWKGEIWYVFITNNPLELISKSRYTNSLGDSFDDREKVVITIEFEGKRIN